MTARLKHFDRNCFQTVDGFANIKTVVIKTEVLFLIIGNCITKFYSANLQYKPTDRYMGSAVTQIYLGVGLQ